MIKDLARKSRSYRRFDESHRLSQQTMRELVECARLAPTGRNRQSLKFFTSWEPEMNEVIFSQLGWAGYLTDWPGPDVGQRPTGYVVVLGDHSLDKNFGCDHGIAAQTILLAAAEQGLGGCLIGSVKRAQLKEQLQLADELEVLLVIALGKPAETVVLTAVRDGDIKYWRDEEGVHYVPKRSLDDILLH